MAGHVVVAQLTLASVVICISKATKGGSGKWWPRLQRWRGLEEGNFFFWEGAWSSLWTMVSLRSQLDTLVELLGKLSN